MGRQEHGWFGDGEGPEKSEAASVSGGMFGPDGLSTRIQAVACGTVGALPQALRARAAAQYGAGNLARLTGAMTARSGATQLSDAEFSDRLRGRTGGVAYLREGEPGTT